MFAFPLISLAQDAAEESAIELPFSRSGIGSLAAGGGSSCHGLKSLVLREESPPLRSGIGSLATEGGGSQCIALNFLD